MESKQAPEISEDKSESGRFTNSQKQKTKQASLEVPRPKRIKVNKRLKISCHFRAAFWAARSRHDHFPAKNRNHHKGNKTEDRKDSRRASRLKRRRKSASFFALAFERNFLVKRKTRTESIDLLFFVFLGKGGPFSLPFSYSYFLPSLERGLQEGFPKPSHVLNELEKHGLTGAIDKSKVAPVNIRF